MYLKPLIGDNAPPIQRAVDQAASDQCGEVQLAPGFFDVSRPIQLRSGVHLSGQRFRRTFSTLRPTSNFVGKAILLTRFAPETKERKQVSFYLERLRLEARPSCPSRKGCAPAKVDVGLWLENTAYPTIRDCEFINFPEAGAAIRGGGVLYLKLLDSRFIANLGWSVDLAMQYVPRSSETGKPTTYYAVSVGSIARNYFATRRGVRLSPGYGVTVRENQFEGGLSMIHAYEGVSSRFAIEDNYFELSKTPEDVPGRGTIALRGTGRIVGNLINGPPKGKLPHYPGPGIEILGGSVTVADNTIRCFDPGVLVNGSPDDDSVREYGNVIAPKKHVELPWQFRRGAPPGEAQDPSDLRDSQPAPSPGGGPGGTL